MAVTRPADVPRMVFLWVTSATKSWPLWQATSRTVADDLRAARPIVTAALDELEAQGEIERKDCRGCAGSRPGHGWACPGPAYRRVQDPEVRAARREAWEAARREREFWAEAAALWPEDISG